MSLYDILTVNNPNPESWQDFSISNLNTNTLSVSGSIISSGNITVQNASPAISILNNTLNGNRATLIVQGASNLQSSSIQQGTNGILRITPGNGGNSSNDLELDAIGNGNIVANPQGTGYLKLVGPQYPAVNSLLTLNANQQVIPVPFPLVSNSFTPILQFGNQTTGITYVATIGQIGKYNKIGNIIFYEIFIQLTAKGSLSGNATISGFPLSTSASPMIQSTPVTTFSNITITGAPSSLSLQFPPSSSVPGLYVGGSSDITVTWANFATNSLIAISGFYFTS